MRFTPLLLLLPLAVPALRPVSALAQPDPQAVAISQRVTEAMGGSDLLQSQRMLVFRFSVVRDGVALSDWHHAWDRFTGDYRLEGTTRDSTQVLVLFNVDSRQGRVWLNGEEAQGDEAAPYLELGYGRFINDSYWLLMPWKWLDPGVHLSYTGTDTVDGEEVDVVQLSFDSGIGLTCNDTYWGYVSRESNLMVRWAYVLQDDEGNPGEDEPTVWNWVDWEPVEAGIRFSRRREPAREGSTVEIRFPLVRTSAERDDALFAPPAAAPEADR
jgi:hypothetical protein